MEEHGLTSIDLIKLDCEGEEYAILDRIAPDVLARVRRIVMEAHDLDQERTPPRLADALASRGFDVRIEAKPDRTAMVWARRRT